MSFDSKGMYKFFFLKFYINMNNLQFFYFIEIIDQGERIDTGWTFVSSGKSAVLIFYIIIYSIETYNKIIIFYY